LNGPRSGGLDWMAAREAEMTDNGKSSKLAEKKIFGLIEVVPLLLVVISVIALTGAKYLQSPGLAILTVIITTYLYYKYRIKKEPQNYGWESLLTRLSIFIIIVGVVTVVIIKILLLLLGLEWLQ
jgi:amino acid permease